MQKLTPAQQAEARLYISKYTDVAMRSVPPGTADRAAAAQAAQQFIEADPSNFYKKFEWINFDPSDPYLIKRFGADDEHQERDVFYIITGHWDEILEMLRHPKFCNREDVSDSVCSGQHNSHAAADVMFRRHVLKQEGLDELALALDAFVKNCGVAHIFASAMFIGDPPIAHVPYGDRAYRAVWAEDEQVRD